MGFREPVALAAWHRTENFQCGVLSLDEWVRKHALQSHRSGGSRVFVTTETDPDIAGYYALAAGRSCLATQQRGWCAVWRPISRYP